VHFKNVTNFSKDTCPYKMIQHISAVQIKPICSQHISYKLHKLYFH